MFQKLRCSIKMLTQVSASITIKISVLGRFFRRKKYPFTEITSSGTRFCFTTSVFVVPSALS